MKKINPLILLTFGIILTKATSFFENIILAYVYGTSALSDSFILTLTLPNVFFAVVSTAIAQCYVPVYQKKYSNLEKKGHQFTFVLMIMMAILGFFISLFIYFFIPYIVKLIAPKATNEVIQLTCTLMKSMCWVSMIVFQLGILQGYFQVIKEFFVVGIISVPLNVGLSITLLFGVKNIELFKIGIYLSYLFQFLIFMYYAHRKGLRCKSLKLDDEIVNSIKQIFYMMLPLFLGGLINDLNAIIDRAFASSYPAGILSGMDYGNKISGIIYAFISVPIMTVFYPRLAKVFTMFDNSYVNYRLKKVLFYTILFSLPIVVITILFSKEICFLLFFRGNFTLNSLSITSQSLKLYSLSIIPMIIRNFLEKIFYINSNTTDPMKNTLVTLFINIIGNFFLSYFYGFNGLIISTIISFLISITYMFYKLHKTYNLNLTYSEMIKTCLVFISVLIVSTIMFIIKQNLLAKLDNIFIIILVISLFSFITICFYCIIINFFKLTSKKKLVNFFKEMK